MKLGNVYICDGTMNMARCVFDRKDDMAWVTFRFTGTELTLIEDRFCVNDEHIPFIDVWDLFVDSLPEDNVRYGLIEFKNEQSLTGGVRSKCILVLWAPDNATVKQKLIATTHSDDVFKKLTTDRELMVIQANDRDDLRYTNVLDRIRKKTIDF